MKKTRLLLCSGLLLCCVLAGCSSQDTAADTAASQTAATVITEGLAESSQPDPSVPETAVTFDTAARLAETETEAAVLQERLRNDPSLTQADMNELAGQQYTLWDTLLNELWAELTHTLPETQMQQLLQEERAWIRWKESSVALAADHYSGGSLSILAAETQAAKLTQDRVYELEQILTSRQYPITPSAADLYRQVYLPLISSGRQPDYENLLLLLEFRRFSLLEDEGTIQIQDPQFPEVYLFGSLSNETGSVTIPQLGYCFGEGASRQGVRVDFFTEPPCYYTGAVFWDDGTEVDSIEELSAYLAATN